MPKLYALIGNPLKHSFSEAFFNAKFKQEGIDAVYQNFEIKDINSIISICHNHINLYGFNVTMPYKEAIIPLLSDLDSSAQNVGAVNTVKVFGRRMIGYNTDIFGFEKLWNDNIKTQVNSVLILGRGGASKAIQNVLKSKNINYVISSRNDILEHKYDILKYEIIINATPVGMFPFCDDVPPIDTNKINKNHIIIDLIYNPNQTKLLQIAASRGAKTINGMPMFLSQAEKSWKIWNKS